MPPEGQEPCNVTVSICSVPNASELKLSKIATKANTRNARLLMSVTSMLLTQSTYDMSFDSAEQALLLSKTLKCPTSCAYWQKCQVGTSGCIRLSLDLFQRGLFRVGAILPWG